MHCTFADLGSNKVSSSSSSSRDHASFQTITSAKETVVSIPLTSTAFNGEYVVAKATVIDDERRCTLI